jgi:hypothetical protein
VAECAEEVARAEALKTDGMVCKRTCLCSTSSGWLDKGKGEPYGDMVIKEIWLDGESKRCCLTCME